MRRARLVALGWLLGLRLLATSGFFVFVTVVQPLLFATLAILMFRAGTWQGPLSYVVLGAALMGMWSAMLYGSASWLQFERWAGVLEPHVVAPASFVAVHVGMMLSTATVGGYSLVATAAWGVILFGVPLEVAHPLWALVCLLEMVVSLGLLGLLFAATFVFSPRATAISNLLEYPLWLVSGILVPVALLPAWGRTVSNLLAPAWSGRAIRAAVLGGDPSGPFWTSVAISAVYLVLASAAIHLMLWLGRRRATFSMS